MAKSKTNFADPKKLIRNIVHQAFEGVFESNNAADFATKHHKIASELTSAAGQIDLMPYQYDMLALLGSDNCPPWVYTLKSSRVGMTTVALAASSWFIHNQRNVMLVQPTATDARSFAKTSVESTFRENDVLSQHMESIEKSGWTVGTYVINSSVCYVRGATPNALRRVDLSVAIGDEFSAWKPNIGKTYANVGEGDAAELLGRGTRLDPTPLVWLLSTPKDIDTCPMWSKYEQAKIQLSWHVLCPGCSTAIPLRWANFEFLGPEHTDEERAESTAYRSQCCGHLWTQEKLPQANEKGFFMQAKYPTHGVNDDIKEIEPNEKCEPYWGWRLVCPKEKPPYLVDESGKKQTGWPVREVGFHIWLAYNPLYNWKRITYEFLKSRHSQDSMIAFETLTRGIPSQSLKTSVDTRKLSQCRMDLSILPDIVKHVGVSVDVQQWGLFVAVFAADAQLNVYLLECLEFLGSVDDISQQSWQQLFRWLHDRKKYKREDGIELHVQSVVCDCGYMSPVVYTAFGLFPVSGAKYLARGVGGDRVPIARKSTRRHNGRLLPLIEVGDTPSKDYLVDMFQKGKVKIHNTVKQEHLEQYAAEKRIRKRSATGGGLVTRYVKNNQYAVNDLIDCHRYFMSMLLVLNINWRMCYPNQREIAEAKTKDEKSRMMKARGEIGFQTELDKAESTVEVGTPAPLIVSKSGAGMKGLFDL